MVSHSSKRGLNNADKWNDLLHLYKTKMSLKEIALRLHVSLTSLNSKIKELGLKREPRYKKKPIDIKLFKDLIKLEASDITIANRLGICTDTVIKLKKQYGFATKDEQRISNGKKGSACRMHYKKTGTKPLCPTETNILEKYSDDIIQLLEDGVSKTEIAEKYGVCTSTVYNFIHLYDIDAPVKKICDNQEKYIQEAFEAGKSLEDISDELNCHMLTTYHKVKDMQLSRAQSDVKRKSLLNNQEEEIRRLYEEGISGTEIAKLMGVSYPSIYEFIRRKQFDARPIVHKSIFDGHDGELLQMRQSGMTLKQIGKYFGVKANTVLHRIQKLQAQSI